MLFVPLDLSFHKILQCYMIYFLLLTIATYLWKNVGYNVLLIRFYLIFIYLVMNAFFTRKT